MREITSRNTTYTDTRTQKIPRWGVRGLVRGHTIGWNRSVREISPVASRPVSICKFAYFESYWNLEWNVNFVSKSLSRDLEELFQIYVYICVVRVCNSPHVNTRAMHYRCSSKRVNSCFCVFLRRLPMIAMLHFSLFWHTHTHKNMQTHTHTLTHNSHSTDTRPPSPPTHTCYSCNRSRRRKSFCSPRNHIYTFSSCSTSKQKLLKPSCLYIISETISFHLKKKILTPHHNFAIFLRWTRRQVQWRDWKFVFFFQKFANWLYLCGQIQKSWERTVKLLNKSPFPFSDAISLKVWKNKSESSYECKYLPSPFPFSDWISPSPICLPMYIYIHVPVCGRGLAHFCCVW